MDEEKIKIKFNRTTFTCFNCNKDTENKWFLLKGNNEMPNSASISTYIKEMYVIQNYIIYNTYNSNNIRTFIKNNNNLRTNASTEYPIYVGKSTNFDMYASQCNECKNKTIWFKSGDDIEKMVWPKVSIAPKPNNDMSKECKTIFEEARNIFEESPRAAAILLRIVLEKNIKDFFNLQNEKNIMMGDLLKQEEIKNTLESIGLLKLIHSVKNLCNEAAHSSIMLLDNETIDDCNKLFEIINYFCDQTISRKIKNNSFQEKWKKSN